MSHASLTERGITERTTQAIIADLESAGYLTRTRTGRRTLYTVNPHAVFRHPAQDGHRVGPFLELLAAIGGTPRPGQPDPSPAGPDTPAGPRRTPGTGPDRGRTARL